MTKKFFDKIHLSILTGIFKISLKLSFACENTSVVLLFEYKIYLLLLLDIDFKLFQKIEAQ